MSNHSFFAPSRSAFGALCQTSRSRQRAKSSRAAAVEPQLAPLCGRSLLASFPLFTHCLSNTAVKVLAGCLFIGLVGVLAARVARVHAGPPALSVQFLRYTVADGGVTPMAVLQITNSTGCTWLVPLA